MVAGLLWLFGIVFLSVGALVIVLLLGTTLNLPPEMRPLVGLLGGWVGIGLAVMSVMSGLSIMAFASITHNVSQIRQMISDAIAAMERQRRQTIRSEFERAGDQMNSGLVSRPQRTPPTLSPTN